MSLKCENKNFNTGEYIDEIAMNDLRLMRDDIYYGYCIAMFYKTWPLKKSFDIHVLHVVESGIQRYWETQVCKSGLKPQPNTTLPNVRAAN